jgi:transcriptional regulator with XRE-family HTH domain
MGSRGVAEVHLSAMVGDRVRAARTAHGWTLDVLAERSGVSRRMVINVEQGATNASIATLLRLSSALGVSLASLVDVSPQVAMSVRRSNEHRVFWRGENGGKGLLVSSTDPPDVVELWDWSLGPGDTYASEAHALGTKELLHVLSGSVSMTVGDEDVELGAGDALWFSGDLPHTLANRKGRSARFSLSVYEPGVGA